MISKLNKKYSERIFVTNHNSELRNYIYAAPIYITKKPEIPRSKEIGQATNPFIGIADDFVSFIGRYHHHFTVSTGSVATQAEQYLCGLMQSDNRNMERMAEVVPDSNEQSFQNFISNSQWSSSATLDQIGIDADSFFGDDPETCLIIDETSFIKKGIMSVGVARQWCGRLGKVENCQVGVFAALSYRNHVTLINTRLYLPEVWINNPERCRKAGIPEEFIVYQKKLQQALDMVKPARINSIHFNWVGIDGGYGKELNFLRDLVSTSKIRVKCTLGLSKSSA